MRHSLIFGMEIVDGEYPAGIKPKTRWHNDCNEGGMKQAVITINCRSGFSRSITNSLQHYLNALHVCCFLCKPGIPITMARKISMAYEFFTNHTESGRQLNRRVEIRIIPQQT